jgi:hypothetical protein
VGNKDAKKSEESDMLDDECAEKADAKKSVDPTETDETSEKPEKAKTVAESTKTDKKAKDPKKVDIIHLRNEWIDVWKSSHEGSGISARELQRMACAAWKTSEEREYLTSCYSDAEKKRRRL